MVYFKIFNVIGIIANAIFIAWYLFSKESRYYRGKLPMVPDSEDKLDNWYPKLKKISFAIGCYTLFLIILDFIFLANL